MCLLLPFLYTKKKQSDRAKAASAAEGPRPVTDGYADTRSMGQPQMGQPHMVQSGPYEVS